MGKKLKKGQQVTVLIPFTYTIGDEGVWSGKQLNTVEDCKNEVRAELENDVINSDNVMLTIGGY